MDTTFSATFLKASNRSDMDCVGRGRLGVSAVSFAIATQSMEYDAGINKTRQAGDETDEIISLEWQSEIGVLLGSGASYNSAPAIGASMTFSKKMENKDTVMTNDAEVFMVFENSRSVEVKARLR